MCTRTYRKTPPSELATLFEAQPATPEDDEALLENFNVAPTDAMATVILSGDGRRALIASRWGLIPSWEQDPKSGTRRVNARAETVAEKPSFRTAFQNQRCLVLVDGFYEWRKAGKQRTPFAFSRSDDQPLALAGLWAHWKGACGDLVSSTVLTTTANTLMAPLHDRMPVVLDQQGQSTWLSLQSDAGLLHELLSPCAAQTLRVHEVDRRVNHVRSRGKNLIAPVLKLPLLS